MQQGIVTHTVFAKGILMQPHIGGHHTQMQVEVTPSLPHADDLHRITWQQGHILIGLAIDDDIDGSGWIRFVGKDGVNAGQFETLILRVSRQASEQGVFPFQIHLLISDIVSCSVIQAHTDHLSFSISRCHKKVGDIRRDVSPIVIFTVSTCHQTHRERHTQDVSQQRSHNCGGGWHTWL